jgi:hypothetical protein
MSVMHARVARNEAGQLRLTVYRSGTHFPSWRLDPEVDPQFRGILQPMLTQASALRERAGMEQVAPWETATMRGRIIDFRAAVTA